MTFVLESRQEGVIRLFPQPNCKGLLGGTRGTSEQILSYAPRVIHLLVYKSSITQTFCSHSVLLLRLSHFECV
jgi:hypothetical protein